MINLSPCSGLCNRLRAMNGAYWRVRRLGCLLNVIWCADDSMDTRFPELFEAPEAIMLIEMDHESCFSQVFLDIILLMTKRVKDLLGGLACQRGDVS